MQLTAQAVGKSRDKGTSPVGAKENLTARIAQVLRRKERASG